MAGPTTHSALGASSAERWFNCPGSARVNASLPKQPDSVWSREGTRAHALVQHCLEKGIETAAKFVGKPVPDHHDDLTPVTEDMADAVQVYIDYVYRRLKLAPKGRVKLFIEQKFKLPFLGRDLDGSIPGGTNDCSLFFLDTGELEVIDYKHGAGKFVSVKGNKQGRYYGLGAQEWLRQHGAEVTSVVITIVQPRCDFVEEKVRSERLTLDQLFDFREDALAAAHAARQPNAPCVAGPWCKGTWCAGALQVACDTFKEAATAGIIQPAKPRGADVFTAVNLAPVTIDPTTLSSDELGKRIAQAELLDDYLSCLRAYAASEAKAGRMPTGCKWVEGKSNRAWSKPESEVIKTLQALGNSIDPAPRTLLSVAKAEQLVGKAKFKALAPELVTKPKGKPTLVPSADQRPEYVGSIETENEPE